MTEKNRMSTVKAVKKAAGLFLFLTVLLCMSTAVFASGEPGNTILDTYGFGHFSSASEFISDTEKAAYIDRMAAYYLRTNEDLQFTLSAGQPVLMFFEGGSDTGIVEPEGKRTGAVCLVIRSDGGENYIAYYCKACNTMPDYPFGYEYDNGHDDYGAATMLDGVYSLYTVNHRDIYAGFNVRTGDNACIPSVYMRSDGSFSVLNGNGINVHTRLTDAVSGDVTAPYTAGCLVIGGGQPYAAYLAFLQASVPDSAALEDAEFGGGYIQKYDYDVIPHGTKAGSIVVDRWLARDTMTDLYNGNAEAVACITAFSASAQAEEAAQRDCLSGCTVYPSYLSAVVEPGKPLMSLPISGTTVSSTKGGTLTVTALYKNAAGEYWYRVFTGTEMLFLRAEYALSTETRYDDISIHNYNYPTVKVCGKSFSVTGIAATRYNALTSVNGYILSPEGTAECEQSVTDILRSCSLNASDGWCAYSESLDYRMAFSGLSLGEHRYKITATAENFYVADNVLHYAPRELVLVDEVFRVATQVILDPQGGTVETEILLTDANGYPEELPVPEKEGFVFVGWVDENGVTVDTQTAFMENTTVTAQWEPIPAPASEEAMTPLSGEEIRVKN